MKDLGYCILIHECDPEVYTCEYLKVDLLSCKDICKILDCNFFNIVRSASLRKVVPNGVLLVDDVSVYKYDGRLNAFASKLADYPICGPAVLLLEEDYDLSSVPYSVLYDLYGWEETLC